MEACVFIVKYHSLKPEVLLLSTVFAGNFYCQQFLAGAFTYLFNKVLQNAAASDS